MAVPEKKLDNPLFGPYLQCNAPPNSRANKTPSARSEIICRWAKDGTAGRITPWILNISDPPPGPTLNELALADLLLTCLILMMILLPWTLHTMNIRLYDQIDQE